MEMDCLSSLTKTQKVALKNGTSVDKATRMEILKLLSEAADEDIHCYQMAKVDKRFYGLYLAVEEDGYILVREEQEPKEGLTEITEWRERVKEALEKRLMVRFEGDL